MALAASEVAIFAGEKPENATNENTGEPMGPPVLYKHTNVFTAY